MPQHSWDTEIYYKIIVPNTPTRQNKFFIIATLQGFDETDYNEREWLQDGEGIVSFDSAEQAREYLADMVDQKWVRTEDQIPKTDISFYRRSGA